MRISPKEGQTFPVKLDSTHKGFSSFQADAISADNPSHVSLTALPPRKCLLPYQPCNIPAYSSFVQMSLSMLAAISRWQNLWPSFLHTSLTNLIHAISFNANCIFSLHCFSLQKCSAVVKGIGDDCKEYYPCSRFNFHQGNCV